MAFAVSTVTPRLSFCNKTARDVKNVVMCKEKQNTIQLLWAGLHCGKSTRVPVGALFLLILVPLVVKDLRRLLC